MADWNMAFGGLTIGPGTNYEVKAISGLTDMPSLRVGDVTRARKHGLHPGDDFASGRSITIVLDIAKDDSNTISDLVDAYLDAFTYGDSETALTFTIPGVAGGATGRVLARCRRRSIPVNLPYQYGIAEAVVELVATDPRIYTNGLNTDTVDLENAAGGVSFPLTFPFTFGSSSTGSIQAVNSGNFPAPVVLTIDGPITNPSVLNNTTGEELAFTITLASGESLVIDTEARTVLLNGTASRYSTLSTDSVWFDLQPGTTELKLTGSTAGSPLLTAEWRSAWL